MALATKCPHCNTIFRVAHDQLKLRGGIVRCGSCNQVFDGNAALLEPLQPLPPFPAPLIPLAAEPNPLDLDPDNLNDGALPELPAMAMAQPQATLPDSVASLSLEFDDGPVLEPEPLPEAEPWPEPSPEVAPEPKPLSASESAPEPVTTPTAQDLLGNGAALSEAELQAAIDIELAALDARMAAAQPAPALPTAEPAPEPAGQSPAPSSGSDQRREPTLDFSRYPDQLDEEDELALLQLSKGAARPHDDIPPSHTLLRTASAPPADRYDEPAFHSTETIVAESVAEPVADRHTLEPAVEAAADVDGADDEPGFVKRERYRERYGRATTIALCLGIVLMLGALVAQGLTTFRNPLAAAMPSLKPTLVAACQTLGCKVELPSQIDELAIEQGELQTLSENTFSFSTALKNSSGSAQAWPHIELVLDDANDKTVLRRVFAPRDYLDREIDIGQGFPARSEQPVKLYFELKQPRVSGYHIAVFYP